MLSPIQNAANIVSSTGSTGGRLMGYARTLYLCLPFKNKIFIRSNHNPTVKETHKMLYSIFTDPKHMELGSSTHNFNKTLVAASGSNSSESFYHSNGKADPSNLITPINNHQPATSICESLIRLVGEKLIPSIKISFNTKHFAKNDLFNFSSQTSPDYRVDYMLQNKVVIPTFRDCKVSNNKSFFNMLNGTNYYNTNKFQMNFYFVGGIPANYVFSDLEMKVLMNLIQHKAKQLLQSNNSDLIQYVKEDIEPFKVFRYTRCIADLQKMKIAPMIITQHDVATYLHSLPDF